MKTFLAEAKERWLRYWRIADIQARHPSLRCHHTADVRVEGRLIARGPVNIGKDSKIYVAKGAVLLFGGRNMILENVLIAPSSSIEIGEDVSIQDGCHVLGDVAIGRGTLLAPRVFLCSSMHSFRGMPAGNVWPWLPIRLQDRLLLRAEEAVVIGGDCWIGINTTFMPGSCIGDGCVVGATSIVIGRHDASYSIYAGSPARLVGYRWIPSPRQLHGGEDDSP